MSELTVTSLTEAMPNHIKSRVDQTLVDHVKNLVTDPEFAEVYQENLLSYANVMEKGKFKLEAYINAVRYVSFKSLGETNIEAYMHTFPAKYSAWKASGVDQDTINKYVYAYNWGKLVQILWKQSVTPFLIYNQANRQEALNIQMGIARTAKSEMARTSAANSVLNHLKPPEELQQQLQVTVEESSALGDLREAMSRMAEMSLQGGRSAKAIAGQPLTINGECTDES